MATCCVKLCSDFIFLIRRWDSKVFSPLSGPPLRLRLPTRTRPCNVIIIFIYGNEGLLTAASNYFLICDCSWIRRWDSRA